MKMRVVAIALAIVVAGATAAQAWYVEAHIRRPTCDRVVFHVENYGNAVRHVTLKTGQWERYVSVPSWGGIRVVRESDRPSSVWFRGERLVRVPAC